MALRRFFVTTSHHRAPQGEFDVALTLSDMMFAANGSQLYDDRTHSGLWGDVILVNGRPPASGPVAVALSTTA